MRPQSQIVSAVGVSPWMVLDYEQRPFNVALMASLSSAASGVTYKVEYTPDNPNNLKGPTVVSLTRVTTTATLTFNAAHNLSANDSVVVFGSGDPNLDGTQVVASVTSPTVLTYTVANTGLTAALPQVRAIPLRVFPHDYMVALSAKADGNFAFPCMACRLNVSAIAAGTVELTVIQGYGRG